MSEASQYQAIRRHWKRLYRNAQVDQSIQMRIVMTGNVPKYVWSDPVEYRSATLAEVESALRSAVRFQCRASECMNLLNRFVVKRKKP